MDERVPFRAGLFREGTGGACLLGNRCRSCGRIYFPGRTLCLDCLAEELEPIEFGREGKLYSYTISHMASLHFGAPYYAGWIDVPEGIRVFAPLFVEEGVRLEIGMRMDLSIDELWQQGDRSVVGYRFRAVPK